MKPSEPGEIRFDNGAEYEEFMGRWSRLVGNDFLNWLAPPAGARWVDVGCGNGAFTELIVQRCAPAGVEGIDPSDGQLDFARTRPALAGATVTFRAGDAMALPWPDRAFDAAVMALVIFFVLDPARGVGEMVRVVKPGGIVSAYAWDFYADGFPIAALHQAMADIGITPLWPPSVEASKPDVLRALWTDAGLVDVQMREITVQRTFDDFENYWRIALTAPRIAPKIATMAPDEVAALRERLRARLPVGADGRITSNAFANAIHGRVPG